MSWGRAIVPKCPNCGKTSIYPTERATDLRPHSRIAHRPQNWAFSTRPRLPSPLSSARDVRSVDNLSTMTESFYERLDIPVSGSNDDIKRAYKQLARKYHPDVSPPDRAEEYTQRFILLQEAYETLSDPQCRALYDRDLARGFHLAFSSRRQFDEELEAKSVWQNRWQHQLEELDRRSAANNLDENLSWGARMRRRREESSTY